MGNTRKYLADNWLERFKHTPDSKPTPRTYNVGVQGVMNGVVTLCFNFVELPTPLRNEALPPDVLGDMSGTLLFTMTLFKGKRKTDSALEQKVFVELSNHVEKWVKESKDDDSNYYFWKNKGSQELKKPQHLELYYENMYHKVINNQYWEKTLGVHRIFPITKAGYPKLFESITHSANAALIRSFGIKKITVIPQVPGFHDFNIKNVF